MIRCLVFNAQPAEPTIREIQLDLFTQSPLRADTLAVTDNQHPEHQLRFDRWSSGMTVERLQRLAQELPGKGVTLQPLPPLRHALRWSVKSI